MSQIGFPVRLFIGCVAALLATFAGAAPILGLPSAGRWSVATSWADGWPAEWRHADPERTESIGEWTYYYGRFLLPDGVLEVQDAERPRLDLQGVTELRRRWHWTGSKSLERLTLSIRFKSPLRQARPFLPGISLYDNPAGQAVDASRIPVIAAATPHPRGFYEEHRFPLVFAALEGLHEGQVAIAALHSVPSPLRFGRQTDQWWSLGVDYAESGVELALLSGPVASNGRNAMIKGHQRRWHEYPDAWCTLPPGATIEKTCYLETGIATARGSGFQVPLATALRLTPALNADGFPPVRDVVLRKFADTDRRWRDGRNFAGVHAFPGEKRPWIDLAWAGQSEAYAYPLLRLGERLQQKLINDRVQRGLDFISTAPFGPGGFSVRYDFAQGAWLDRTNPLSQGQAMENMLHALRLARAQPGLDTSRWEAFLKRACDFHAARILDPAWRPISTNEGFLIAPLAHATRLFQTPRYLEAARKAGDHYAQRHLSMDEPYWGGTLDARCEDKEGAWAAFQGFLTLHEATQEPRYLRWATHAADVILTYLYIWDVPLPPGRLSDHAFKTRGWTSVSVQNMHLDVYGVLCAPAFWRLGDLTGREDYRRLARLMLVSCGQLLDPKGSQGEQIQQTNYAQHYDYQELSGVRGDYVESWNVYWITAHFLVAAAQLDELGVDVLNW